MSDESITRTSSFRVPPQAVEVEKHVLGALFLDHDATETVSQIIKPSDFYIEKHSLIFRAALKLRNDRSQVDLMTVIETLKKYGAYDNAGGEDYLKEICSEVVSFANLRDHAKIIKEKSILRSAITAGTKMLERAYSGEMDPKDVIELAAKDIFKLEDLSRDEQQGLVSMRDGLMRYAKQLDERAAGKEHRLRLGITAIDDVMQGLRIGSLNLLAARPGVGKSALALQAAIECQQPVALFSLEMMIEEEYERMMAQINPELNADGLSTPEHIRAKRAMLEAAMIQLSKYPIWICEDSYVTPPFVLSECRRMKRELGDLKLIEIDYLQMMKSTEKHSRRDLEVGGVSGDLKRIAKELSVPILAVASLSRKSEERDNKRPVDSDLREAGQLESDAHGIIFLYRESKYNKAAEKDETIKTITEAIIAKNRGGKTGRTLIDFRGATSRFLSMTGDRQKAYWNFLAGKDFMGEEKKVGHAKKGKGKQAAPDGNWGKPVGGVSKEKGEDSEPDLPL